MDKDRESMTVYEFFTGLVEAMKFVKFYEVIIILSPFITSIILLGFIFIDFIKEKKNESGH